jgi:glycine/D-amino acid oxidase-like deaminating enzyme
VARGSCKITHQVQLCMFLFKFSSSGAAKVSLPSNPKGLGKWLYDRCREYRVRIETDCTLFKVHLCDCGKLRSVLVKSAQGYREYECDDLVFAAGTRTPQLVRELFPYFGRDFHETTNSGNWIIVKSATTMKHQMRAEVILDDVVDHQLEFVGRENQTTHDFVIWVCGLNNEETKLGNVDDQAEPDEDAINRLRDYAAQFLLNGESAQQEGLEVLEKGRTYRPTIDRELPILTSVSCSDLNGSRISKEQPHRGQRDCAKSGVWVCTGHGKYGITLGLGSGKLMSQMILGEKLDLDVAALGFPP